MSKKALIIYATRTNQTQRIAELIAEGIRFGGVEAKVVNVNDFDPEKDNPKEYDAIVIGSPTYHGEMVQSIKTLLFKLESIGVEGKVGGAFGAFGWSGEAIDRIYNTMLHVLKMNMVSDGLRLKSADLGGGIQMAQAYGKEIAKKVMS
ncbi:MAG: flavodoxin domain-containing protein [Thermodesulforhabdaceae bacterium]